MRKNLKTTILLCIVYLSFYILMNFILNQDIFISRSFKSIFFGVSNNELIAIILIVNTIFYLTVLYSSIKSKSKLITTKFKFIEYTFIGTLIIFTPYLYLIITSELTEFFYNYTNIVFLLYLSIYIFGILLFIFTSKTLLNS